VPIIIGSCFEAYRLFFLKRAVVEFRYP